MKRKICYVTGSRAEYGLMRHTLNRMNKEFDLSLIVTGMHLKKEFGFTLKEIEKDKFKIRAKIDSFSDKDTGEAMAESLGQTLIKTAILLSKNKPEIILLTGDRIEIYGAAIAAALLNIPIVHIHGGDQGDNGAHIDDQIRHSITKFAHIHLAATKKSAQRIIRMGEQPWRVHVVGTPGLDEIIKEKLHSKNYLKNKFKLNFEKPYILALQHPTLTQVKMAGLQMKETLEAIKETALPTILIYPNTDPGSRQIIKVIGKYKNLPFLKTYKSLPRKEFLSLMKYCALMIGNSSSGTIDSPAFKIPTVNIGIRETTREHAGNKIFVNNNKNEILKAINRCLNDKKFLCKVKNCKNPYGDGKATEKIIEILKNLKIDNKLLVKSLTY